MPWLLTLLRIGVAAGFLLFLFVLLGLLRREQD